MENPLGKISRAKKTQEAALQKFGKGLMKKYVAAKMDWENSPRYKKALARAAYEGAASSTPAKEPRPRQGRVMQAKKK